MAVRIVQLGSDRHPEEGVRLGVVRRPPRGVKKENWARDDWFDQWFPDLAPSTELVRFYHEEHPISESRWKRYTRRYRSEMNTPERQRLIELLARLSQHANFSIGCYCEDGVPCHRALLQEMLKQHGAKIAEP